jgi:hypothetical protein
VAIVNAIFYNAVIIVNTKLNLSKSTPFF